MADSSLPSLISIVKLLERELGLVGPMLRVVNDACTLCWFLFDAASEKPGTALRRAIEPRGTARKDDDGRGWVLRPLRAIGACGYACDADDDADFDFGDGAAPDWGRAGATRRP